VLSDENAQETSAKRSATTTDGYEYADSAKKRCVEQETDQPQPTTSTCHHHHDNVEHGNLFYYIYFHTISSNLF